MKRAGLLLTLLLVLLVGILWFITRPAKVRADQLPPHLPDLQNGRTMFIAGGCPSCHAPNRQERNRLSGGAALKSPFGTFYAPNISPHATDGIGGWSEADFVTAMHEGTSPDGHHYYPAFPFTSYRRMRLTDVRDLFAYLKTLPAVEGRAKDHELPAFARMRWTLGFWKLLFLHGDPVQADASRSEAWNRGAYLATGPAHCAECHSPRNVLGAIVSSQRFAGAPDPEGSGGWIANITQAGIGDYSKEDIARVLESGELPNGDSVGGAMRAVVRNTAELSSEDRYAIATYIRSLPPIEGPKRK